MKNSSTASSLEKERTKNVHPCSVIICSPKHKFFILSSKGTESATEFAICDTPPMIHLKKTFQRGGYEIVRAGVMSLFATGKSLVHVDVGAASNRTQPFVALTTNATSFHRSYTTGLGFESIQATFGPRLDGKTYLVTGSTSGIGLHTATLLAQQGAIVLVHGRALQKVRRTLKNIKSHTGNPHVYGYCNDLGTMNHVRALADHVSRDLHKFFGGHLHCLVNNAGVFLEEKEVSADGMEMTWAVNTAAPFLLTAALLPLISSRIVNSSSISLADHVDFNVTKPGAPYERAGHAAYGISKSALNVWGYHLADVLRDRGSRVTVNAVDPGTVSTKLLYAGWGDVSYVALQPEEADDEYWAAVDPSLEAVSGAYFVNRKSRQSPSETYDKGVQKQVWDLLVEQTGASFDWLKEQEQREQQQDEEEGVEEVGVEAEEKVRMQPSKEAMADESARYRGDERHVQKSSVY